MREGVACEAQGRYRARTTPPHVLAAVDTIAAHLRACGYAQCVVSPQSGASFHLESLFDRLDELYRILEEKSDAAR